ncbi:MAG: GNAT family N-acetyltransferase [Gammaproteobacteria bacterium]|nr:MAG: GNAT family N-acetyltransferase [Gammaproteobacteria bacterium]
MIEPVILQNTNVRLEPLNTEHADALAELVTDGNLWELVVTSAPEPKNSQKYIQNALNTADRLAFAVIDKKTNNLIGTTSYHDILANVKRLEIGYTFYGKSYWRSHVNTSCKLLLLTHAFETLAWQTVGWRTDNLNHRSQKAIERLGAKKDGTIRGHALRRDGTVRDTVMYSMTKAEWADAKTKLVQKLKVKTTQ